MTIYLVWKAQIAFLSIEKAPKNILTKYANYVDIFAKKSAVELFEHSNIKEHFIDLEIDE